MYTLGIICILNSVFLFLLGTCGLLVSTPRTNSDMEASPHFKAYSWAAIVLSLILAAVGYALY